MSTAHIHAQDAAWFFFFCLVVVGICIVISMREDKDE